jgi:hypothetical protein
LGLRDLPALHNLELRGDECAGIGPWWRLLHGAIFRLARVTCVALGVFDEIEPPSGDSVIGGSSRGKLLGYFSPYTVNIDLTIKGMRP